MDIKWETPAPVMRGRDGAKRWDQIRAALKDRPGEWALVAVGAWQSTATQQSRPGFEFTSRSRPDYTQPGQADIYARYVGES